MKKILVVLLVSLFLAGTAYASGSGSINRFNQDQVILSYVSENTSNTTYATENVSTDTIVPGYHRILGFTVAPKANAGETAQTDVALVDDADDVMATSANIFAESEASANTTETMWFCYPKEIANGLTIRHGPNSVVIVYYEYQR